MVSDTLLGSNLEIYIKRLTTTHTLGLKVSTWEVHLQCTTCFICFVFFPGCSDLTLISILRELPSHWGCQQARFSLCSPLPSSQAWPFWHSSSDGAAEVVRGVASLSNSGCSVPTWLSLPRDSCTDPWPSSILSLLRTSNSSLSGTPFL